MILMTEFKPTLLLRPSCVIVSGTDVRLKCLIVLFTYMYVLFVGLTTVLYMSEIAHTARP